MFDDEGRWTGEEGRSGSGSRGGEEGRAIPSLSARVLARQEEGERMLEMQCDATRPQTRANQNRMTPTARAFFRCNVDLRARH